MSRSLVAVSRNDAKYQAANQRIARKSLFPKDLRRCLAPLADETSTSKSGISAPGRERRDLSSRPVLDSTAGLAAQKQAAASQGGETCGGFGRRSECSTSER